MTAPDRIRYIARQIEALLHHVPHAHPEVRPQLQAEAARLAECAERVARQNTLLQALHRLPAQERAVVGPLRPVVFEPHRVETVS